jgi:hypothetical protein
MIYDLYVNFFDIQSCHAHHHVKKMLITLTQPYFNVFDKVSIRAPPTVLGMWSSKVQKMDEENPTYAGLAQDNGFGSA